MIERTIAKSAAHQNPSIVNPGTIFAANITKRTFKTSEKMPSVSTVKGNVNTLRIGLITALMNPSTRAAINAAINPVTCTPGKMYAVTMIARAEMMKWSIVFIILNPQNWDLFALSF